MNIVILSTYPPRECGIASFSKDLRDNLVSIDENVSIIAITDAKNSYDYPKEVIFEVSQDEKESFREAADFVNQSSADVVIIQHEYGIFGGDDGSYVLEFANHLKKPFVATTHTVLLEPTFGQKNVLSRLGAAANGIVCMTKRSAKLLSKVYSVPEHKIRVIPHGVPFFEPKGRDELKQKYGYTGRTIVSTFGLIGPGKGIENCIKAISELVPHHPDILYLVLGKTHPNIIKKYGESYRASLVSLVEELGLTDNVKFINEFLSLDKLGDYLYMTDVYVTPYPNKNQAVSGTLTYAVGCGRAIVSTPYEYALEILGDGRGLIAQNSDDPKELAFLIEKIINDPALKQSLENKAQELGKKMSWNNVAKLYRSFLEELIAFADSKIKEVVSDERSLL